MPDADLFLPPPSIGAYLLLLAGGLVAPFLLLPIVHLTGYSEIIEEVVKALAVLYCLSAVRRFWPQVWGVVIFALAFGISETVLYSPTIFQISDGTLLFGRVFLTIPMHVLTTLVIFLPASVKKYYIVVGLVAAIAIHLAFNALIAQFNF